MRKYSSLLMIALLAVASVGCDSSDDTPSDSAKLQGTWALVGISDSSGDVTGTFVQGFNSVVLTNNADGTFAIRVDSKLTGVSTVPGTYTVTESLKRITLSASVGGQTVPLNFTYAFTSDTITTLTADATSSVLINSLFGTSLQGTVTMTVQKQ